MSGLAAQKYGTAMPKIAGARSAALQLDTQQKKRSGLCAPCRTMPRHVPPKYLGTTLGTTIFLKLNYTRY